MTDLHNLVKSAAIIASFALTACHSGITTSLCDLNAVSNSITHTTKISSNELKRVNESLQTLSKAIQTSTTALQTSIQNNSKMTQEDFKEFDREIQLSIDSQEYIYPVIDYTAKKFKLSDTKYYSKLWDYANSHANTIIASTLTPNEYLKSLIKARTGVCDNITVYLYTLLIQAKIKATMLPATLGDHTFLLIKFNDDETVYAIDAWTAYLNDRITTQNMKFAKIDEYLMDLKTFPENNFFNPGMINIDDLTNNYIEYIESAEMDYSILEQSWARKGLDVNNFEEVADLAQTLKNVAK